jgi:hypothetical protein
MTRRPKKKKATAGPQRKRRAAPKRKVQSEPLDDFIAASASALDLKIDKSWLAAVRSHLQVTLQHGARVASFALADEAEPAPVFRA